MSVRIAIGVLLLLSLAHAAPFTVTDQDQANVANICMAAVKSPNVNDAQTLGIAGWCMNWQQRMSAAAQVKPGDVVGDRNEEPKMDAGPKPKADEPKK